MMISKRNIWTLADTKANGISQLRTRWIKCLKIMLNAKKGSMTLLIKTKQAFSFKDMLEEPMTEWDDPFLSKDDEDEDLKRLRGQTVHVGELKKDADNKMVIPTNIPKGLPKTREAEGSKRKIVSTLHSKYKDFHTQVKQ